LLTCKNIAHRLKYCSQVKIFNCSLSSVGEPSSSVGQPPKKKYCIPYCNLVEKIQRLSQQPRPAVRAPASPPAVRAPAARHPSAYKFKSFKKVPATKTAPPQAGLRRPAGPPVRRPAPSAALGAPPTESPPPQSHNL